MRLPLFVLLLSFLSFSCAQESISDSNTCSQETLDSIIVADIDHQLPFVVELKVDSDYSSTKAQIHKSQIRLEAEYSQKKLSLDPISLEFERMLVNEIIPHWYGTPWTFEGHTNTPQVGEIACGYFVSTTLKHMGVNVNRYKLAQQGARNICLSLSSKEDVLTFYNLSPSELRTKMLSEFEEGVYVVGLSYHVGFLYLKGGEMYFIHSNYMDPVEVVYEIASESEAFANTDVYVIGELSNNKTFIENWLSNSEIKVVAD